MMCPSGVHLSVVIPAYNEESRLPGTLAEIVKYLSRQSYGSEIVVVDDGSTDRTAAVAADLHSSPVPVRVCSHRDHANKGKGAAVKLGMLEARGEYRLFMDADNSTTVNQVEAFWPCFQEGFDVVIGSRKAPGANVMVHQAWYKEVAGRCGNLLIRSLAVPGVSDTQAGFKMFSRECAENLFPRMTIERWGFDVEILAAARSLGYRIRELPITWINSPASKVGVRSYFEVMADVYRVRRNVQAGIYRQQGVPVLTVKTQGS